MNHELRVLLQIVTSKVALINVNMNTNSLILWFHIVEKVGSIIQVCIIHGTVKVTKWFVLLSNHIK